MTSANSGLQRPPPSSSLSAGLSKLNTRLPPKPTPTIDVCTPPSANFDERPTKRRKIDGQSPSPSTPSQVKTVAANNTEEEIKSSTARYTRVSWATAVGRSSSHGEIIPGDVEPPPLPARPLGLDGSKDGKSGQPRDSCRRRADVPVPTSPDSMKIPAEKLLQKGKRPPGYFPWVGKHPEDVLSDTNVKQGYYDRPPNPPEKELNTAKAPLYNAFKHRSGLESLSALFSLVLDQKSKHGALSSIPSFKPPARVTLTEAKRKSWIADLANPSVPLRRLSRTIPQGVRGQLLLDQCLLHFVPLSRAIWFIKCVGANDIRTLKRKGVTTSVTVGAESKWLKDWTFGIEQFLESVLNQCGQTDWQDNMQYALRLCTRLYLDNMLDRDHYLDWIVRSLSTADTNLTPFWLIAVNLHRRDLVRFRKRGRQLASALITKYNNAKFSSGKVLQPLAERLRSTLRWLVMSKPGCFLIPDQWQDIEEALSSALNMHEAREMALYNRLHLSNQQAMGTKSTSSPDAVTPEEKIIATLDAAHTPFDMQQLFASLQSISSDTTTLFNTCLEWCISKYRANPARVYLVSRLIRRWQKSGYDVDKAVFEFLATRLDDASVNFDTLKHIFAEMSRARVFSLSRYMQWLTVRGFPFNEKQQESASSEQNFATKNVKANWTAADQLLSEACLVNAEDHVINLRHSLLSKTAFEASNESATLSATKQTISQILKTLDRVKGPIKIDELSFTSIRRMNWTMKLDLSHWLRSQIVEYAKNFSIEIPGKPPLPGARAFTVAHFVLFRQLMECIGDIPILADILRLLSAVKQDNVLAALVDTINYHSEALSAIGALETLQNMYSQAYVSLRAVKPSILPFTTAMLDLCTQFPIKITPGRALQQDFMRGDRGRAVAAYSPFSDTMAESLGQAGATFLDDFEAVLQAETNMNEHIMLSLFSVLTDRIAKSDKCDTDINETFGLCQLLARLRLFRKAQGETLIQDWIAKWLSDLSSPPSVQALQVLIATRCLSVNSILEAAYKLPSSSASKQQIYGFVRKCICGNETDEALNDLTYSAMLGVKHLVMSNPEKALAVLLTQPESWSENAEPCIRILSSCVMDEVNYQRLPADIKEVLPAMIGKLFSVGQSEHPGIEDLIQNTNLLSLPFYQCRLQDLCQASISKTDGKAVDEIAEAILRIFAQQNQPHMLRASTFRVLLRAAGPEVGARLRRMTDQVLVDSLPKILQARIPGLPPAPTSEEKQRTATAIEQAMVLGYPAESNGSPTGCGFLIEKLTILMRYFGGRPEPPPAVAPANNPTTPAAVPGTPTGTAAPTTDGRGKDFLLGCVDYFSALLQTACLKRSAYKALGSGVISTSLKQLQQEQIKLVAIIVGIAVQPSLVQLVNSTIELEQQRKVQETIVYAFDVAATLVDDMSEESRMMCARILKDKMKDERVQWLVGSVTMLGSAQSREAGQGLQMVHETKGVIGEFRPKIWELLESGAGNESDTCLGLGMFGATRN